MLNENEIKLTIKTIIKRVLEFKAPDFPPEFFMGMTRGLSLVLNSTLINPETFSLDCKECSGNCAYFESDTPVPQEESTFKSCSKCTIEGQDHAE